MRKEALVLAAALFALPALGDVVHLKNGGTLEGQVTVTDDGAVITLPVGEVRVSKDAIARIEKKETAIERYLKRAAAIKEDDAEAHYQLGLWAQGAGLKAQAKDEFGKAVALNPNHEGAHKALGHRLVDGKWMTLEQEMQAKGLVQREGQWMTPEAAGRFDALKAEVDAARAKREAAEAELRKAQEQAPQPYVSSYYPVVPYYGYSYVPGYTYSPYVSSYYTTTWPYVYYGWPYRSYYYSSSFCWPRVGISFGWYGGHYSGHRPSGHFGGRPGGGHPGGGRPGGGAPSGGRPGGRR